MNNSVSTPIFSQVKNALEQGADQVTGNIAPVYPYNKFIQNSPVLHSQEFGAGRVNCPASINQFLLTTATSKVEESFMFSQADNSIAIENKMSNFIVRVSDMSGKLLYENMQYSNSHRIDISIPTQLLIIQCIDKEGKRTAHKVMMK